MKAATAKLQTSQYSSYYFTSAFGGAWF